jgi:hypothetical protein
VSAVNFIRDLNVALFHRWEPGRVFMILTGYFDESGTHYGSPATVVSGVMGSAQQWLEYQRRLNVLKKKYGFSVFHAKEFKQKSGQFKGWSDEKCRALFSEFHEAGANLMEAANSILTNADFAKEYRGGDRPRKLRLDTAYGLCFRNCLTYLVLEATRRFGHHKKFEQTSLHVVMEGGHKNRGDAERIFFEMKKELAVLGSVMLKTITFASKDECDPLMMADLLAHTAFMVERREGFTMPQPDGGGSAKGTKVTYLKYKENGLTDLKNAMIARLDARKPRTISSSGARG